MRFAVVMLVPLAGLLASEVGGQEASVPLKLTPAQAGVVVERLLERRLFFGSSGSKEGAFGYEAASPESLNRFFGDKDYRVLEGNPYLGYWQSGTFRWQGTKVAWGGIKAATAEASRISPRGWRLAFDLAAKSRGLTVAAEAPIRITGACVGANIDSRPDTGPPSVVLELRIDSPTGPLRYRLSMAKPSIEEAMGAVIEWAVTFALRVNQQKPKDGP